MTMTALHSVSSRLLLFLAIAGTIAVYRAGLFGGFLFDDHQNIVENAALQSVDGSVFQWIVAALSSNSGMLMRPISMLSFAVNYYISGLDPLSFKATNLAIHVATGLAIYALGIQLIPRLLRQVAAPATTRAIALVAASIWMLHPLHVSNVLYVVQRMNQLSTLFALLGLLCYSVGRWQTLRTGSGLATSLCGLTAFGILSLFSKENGALTFAYALVIECLCFGFSASTQGQQRILKLFFIFTLAVPGAAAAISLAVAPDWLLGGYSVREFTLYERLLTQPRILAHYLLWIAVPLPSWMGIYHDDIATSTGLFSPPATALALAGLAGVATLVWRLRHRSPGLAFGAAWFLVGHAMESTILPLELVFEHRNYLPSAGLLIGATAAIWGFTERIPNARLAGCCVAIVALAAGTATRAHSWGEPYRLAMTMAAHHPESARSLYDAGRAIYSRRTTYDDPERATEQATQLFQHAMRINQHYVHPAVSNVLINYKTDEAPADVVTDLARRLRESPMLHATSVLLLINGITDGRTLVSPEGVRAIFEAAMDNDTTTTAMRAMLLSAYGRYHYLVLRDIQNAVALTMAAAEQDPRSPIAQLNLAKLAIELNEIGIATAAVKRASELDTASVHRDEIRRILERVGAE
ncbi:hypothetical protein [Sinimarinibacterium flocculans]|nr:hypothetical protein [Sinimarinibacterium flocculans]